MTDKKPLQNQIRAAPPQGKQVKRSAKVTAKKAEVPTASLKGLGGGADWKPREAATTVAVGDVVRLRKSHPCGSFDWTIIRIGADIGLSCIGCERRVLLTRADFEKRFKNYLARGDAVNPLKNQIQA